MAKKSPKKPLPKRAAKKAPPKPPPKAAPRPSGRKPPNFRTIGPSEQRSCGGCLHFARNRCKRWEWPVRVHHVCDTWAEKVEEHDEGSAVELTPARQRRDKANDVVIAGGTTVVVHVDGGGAGA